MSSKQACVSGNWFVLQQDTESPLDIRMLLCNLWSPCGGKKKSYLKPKTWTLSSFCLPLQWWAGCNCIISAVVCEKVMGWNFKRLMATGANWQGCIYTVTVLPLIQSFTHIHTQAPMATSFYAMCHRNPQEPFGVECLAQGYTKCDTVISGQSTPSAELQPPQQQYDKTESEILQ